MSPEPPAPAGVEERLERLVEAMAAGSAPDLEDLAAGLGPADRARFRGSALAQELLARRARGEAVAEADFAARLEDAEERAHFAETLADGAAALRALPDELPLGTVLDGRYAIARRLGRGGMGTVYAAFDRELEREVAIKVVRRDGGSRRWEEVFRRESRLLARLGSRNIVAIHDVRESTELTYLVMDLAPGPDLYEILTRVRLDRRARDAGDERSPDPLRAVIGRSAGGERADLLGERTHERCAMRIGREIVRAVEHAHAAGVVHNDLKPRNIVLVPGGEPVLLDFGLASWRAQGEQPGVHGTPEYLTPEEIERQSTINDPLTDVYQLGLVLFELLTLRQAFRVEHGDDFELLGRITSGTRPRVRALVPGTAPELAAIVERALAVDPLRRYRTARELGEDLDRYLLRLPPRHVRLRPARAAALYAGFLARHPATWVVATALVAAFFFMRSLRWAPPTMEAFRYEGNGETLVAGQPIEVREACFLGVEVKAHRPTWLYSFSTFGDDARPETRRLRPTGPDHLSDVMRAGYRGRPDGPLFIDAGQHRVVCTLLREPENYEGLRVIACAQRSVLLDRWQQSLNERERTVGAPATYPEAVALGQELAARVRGEGLALTDAEHAAIFGEVLAAEPADPQGWLGQGVAWFDFLFAVRSAGH